MLCPSCQHWNEKGANFCENCGAELRGLSVAPTVSISVKPASSVPQTTTASRTVTISHTPPPTPQPHDSPDPAVSSRPYQGPHLELALTGSIFKLGDRAVVGRQDPRLQIDFEGYPDSQFVSHHHAQLTRVNGKQYIEDLGSSNGTYINDRRLSIGQIEPLQDGDRVRFGKLQLVYQE